LLGRYLAGIYLRYTLLILVALELLMSGMDYIGAQDKLPDSANLKMLYLIFKGSAALKVTLPISVVFGVIVTKIHLIRRNELVATYALGASRSRVLQPFFLSSLTLSLIYVSAYFTAFTQFEEKAEAIKQNRYFSSSTNDLFLKYDESYIYIERLFPLKKEAEGVRIFQLENKELKRYVEAKFARFEEGAWRFPKAKIIEKPKVFGLQKEGIKILEINDYRALEGFKPEIMDTVFEGKTSFMIHDAALAIWLLWDQGIDTTRIRGVFYGLIFLPLFAPIFVVVIFFTVPISSRFFNLALFSSAAVFLTLAGWGLLFTLSQLSISGTLLPELAILLPFAAAVMFAGYLFKKES